MGNMQRIYGIIFFFFAFLLIASGFSYSKTDEARLQAVLLDIQGPIGPATSDYFSRSLDKAVENRASLVIVQMDTPGGLDTSMRDIIQAIITSPIPVVTYVSPGGARAASAGTYILYASHVAAMAPATNLGAATPVQIGALPDPGKLKKEDPSDKKQDTVKDMDPMSKKVINDAIAYIRGLAEMRGRNAEWAEDAVRNAASLNANDAQKANVIDIVAIDMNALIAQLHGRKVNVLGNERTLDTQNIDIEHIEPDWRSNLLAIITDPNVAFILMLIGVYGLIFEFSSPGAILPGVAGAICLLLALFAFQVLPINYAGFGLMLLGISLMVAEAFAPSFGALGIGGVTAFVIGSIILMDTDIPGYGVSLPLIGTFALFSSALFVFVLVMAVKSRRKPIVSGREQLLGSKAKVLADFTGEGNVRIHGEIWRAISQEPVYKNQDVIVQKIDGLTLWVQSDHIQPEDQK